MAGAKAVAAKAAPKPKAAAAPAAPKVAAAAVPKVRRLQPVAAIDGEPCSLSYST